MPISVVCRCGKSLRANEKAAGRIARCPQCGQAIRFPSLDVGDEPVSIPIDLSSPPSPDPVEVEAPRPFWKDPIVLVGAAVPTIILLAFLAYIIKQGADRRFRERIATLHAEADRLAAVGEVVAAHQKYQNLLRDAGDQDPGDEPTRAHIEAAKRLAPKLWPVVKAELDRREDQLQSDLAAERLSQATVDTTGRQLLAQSGAPDKLPPEPDCERFANPGETVLLQPEMERRPTRVI